MAALVRLVVAGIALAPCLAVAGSPTVVVYDDALRNGFLDYSYGGGTNIASNAVTRNGSAFAVAFDGNNFNAVSFSQPPNGSGGVDYAVAQYPVLRLWLNGGASGGQQLRLFVQRDDAIVGPANGVELDAFIAGGALAANEWREVMVRLDAPPVSLAGSYDRIDLQSDAPGAQPRLYVEDVTIGALAVMDSLFANGFESAAPAPGVLRFSAVGYSLAENGGSATITVQRTGGSSGAVSVQYATADGTANAPGDYAAASGTLSWPNGDAGDRTFVVPLVNDPTDEPDETVALALSNATGGATLGAPTNALLTIVDDDAPAPANALLIEPDVSSDPQLAYGCVGDRFTWRDSANQPRVAVLVHNTGQSCPGGNSRGGELRVFKYEVPGGTRIVRASSSAASGFGYAVSHRNEGGNGLPPGVFDDSPLGHQFPGNFSRVFSGRHHAIFRFTQLYPRYSRTAAGAPTTYPVPVTIDWVFATGTDHPRWAITWDAAGVPVDALEDDSRAPYGELLFDGSATEGAHSVIAGVGWGDRYEFTTTGGPASYGSAWTWNVPNTIPYVKLWTTAVDATMGTVLTQTIQQQDAGGYFGTSRWNTTSAAGNACGAPFGPSTSMPCDFNWPYQSINYSLNPFAPAQTTFNTRLAWGTNFGFLGQQDYFVHGSAFWGGPLPNQTASGWPRKSYSTYIVLGRHTLDPVGAQVAQVETAQSVAATAAIGSVATNGPAGVARVDTIAYAPAGYDPVYAAWTFAAAGNTLDANLAIGAGTLRDPLVVVRNWTSAAAPSLVRLNGATLAPDAGYYGSVRAATQELWLTLNADLAGPNNRLEVFP
jgi:hypothetical protein